MISALLQVGDNVVITIPREHRDWGYNPCPDGTTATVLGFSEIDRGRINNFGFTPGIYVNREWTKLRLDNGQEHTEFTGRLELVDRSEYARRLEAWRESRKKTGLQPREYLRDLPETPFWEGDIVRGPLVPFGDSDQLVVIRISYLDLASDHHGSRLAYHVSDKLGGGWDMAVNVKSLELVRRGNVWKYFHDEPLSFAGLPEEAAFFQMLGQTEEVCNPNSGLYDWTKEEVLAAIQNGTVHAFTVGAGMFGGPPRISAISYKNTGLGSRVAEATLAGFGLSATSSSSS